MMWRQLRVALLAGGILAAATSSVRAGDCCNQSAATSGSVAAAPASAGCGQTTRTVLVNEWVPENYTTTRTVYKQENRVETYTAYRCETVPETRTRTVTVYHKVPEMRTEIRKVCVKVPCVEDRVTCEKHWTCVPECKVVRKCVDKGHWECKEVPAGPGLFEGLGKCFKKGNDCCDPCANACDACPRMKTVKVWVSCPTWEEHTVTVMKRVCETRQVVKKVCTTRTEWKEEAHQVCCYKCVPECKTETYTVCVTRKVPYQCTRNVCVSVPTCETVTCTRMVCRQVAKQVVCNDNPCCNADACCGSSCSRGGLFSGLSCKFSGLSFRGRCGCGSSSSCCE